MIRIVYAVFSHELVINDEFAAPSPQDEMAEFDLRQLAPEAELNAVAVRIAFLLERRR